MVPVMYPTSPRLALVLGALVPLLASVPLAAQPREQLATVPPPVVVVVPVVPATPGQAVPVAPAAEPSVVLQAVPTVPVVVQPIEARKHNAAGDSGLAVLFMLQQAGTLPFGQR
jgi:hypothetical protein